MEAAVAIENLLAGDSGDPLAKYNNASKVGWVGGGDCNDGGAFAGTCFTEGFDRFGQSVLFAGEARDEAATSNLAAGLKTAENIEQIAPFRSIGFAGEEVAEEDSIPVEELTSEGLEGSVGAARFFDRGCSGVELLREKRPAASGVACGTLAWGIEGGGTAAGIHAGAELIESVSRGETGGGELPESVLGLLAGQTRYTLEIVREAGSALLEEGPQLETVVAEGRNKFFFFDRLLGESVGEPVGGLADVERNGGGIGGDHSAWPRVFVCG